MRFVIKMKTFYWYFRPLAICFKIMGSFPLDNALSTNTSKLRFRLFSCSHIYSSVVFLLSVITLVIFVRSIEHSESAPMVKFVIYVMIGRAVTSFVMYGARSYKQLPKLIALLDNFDKRKKSILKEENGSPLVHILLHTIFPGMFTCFIVSITGVLCLSVMNTIIPAKTNFVRKTVPATLFFSFIMNMQIVLAFQYIYFVKNISARFIQINKTVIELGITTNGLDNKPSKFPPSLYATLSKIRVLHNMLNESVSQLGNIFGSFIALDQLFVIGMFVLNISVFVIFYKNVHCLLYLTIEYGCIVLGVSHQSQRVKDNVSMFIA